MRTIIGNSISVLFSEIPGGSCEVVQGCECWIPPVGQIFDPRQGKWIKVPVYRRHQQWGECYWEPDPRWKKLAAWEKEEEDMQRPIKRENEKRAKQDLDPLNLPNLKVLDNFRDEMWRNRLGGFWFYNNNKPTYITGHNWFYLSVYQGKFKTPNKLPKWREIDRQYFYFFQANYEDPETFGIIEKRKRQDGKSYRAGSIALDLTTYNQQFHAGIQSKTDDDAAAFFEKTIINPFRKLPSFFVPNSNLEGKKVTVAELIFLSKNARAEDGEELESKISYRASTLKAYDGETLGLYIGDEEGKTKHIIVYDRWRIAQYCLRDEEGKKTGFSIHTSTIESSAEGGKSFDDMWDDSNQHEMGDRKRTKSWLKKFFISAALARNLDAHGFADEAKSTAEILAERPTDPRALSQAKRREPLNEKEASSVDASKCVYDPIRLSERYEALVHANPSYTAGNFRRKNGEPDGEVLWIPNSDGRFLMMWEPPPERRNLRIQRGDQFFPGAKWQGAGGCDPYDSDILAVGGEYTMSMGSIVIMKKPYLLDDTIVEGGPALIYSYRPDSPNELYEDCIMAAQYYGVQILIETNKVGCDKHFRERGYGAYSYKLPDKNKSGIYSGAQSKGAGVPGQITDVTEQFIFESLNTVYFPQLIEQWLNWSPMATTKYDLAVAFGYAVMLMNDNLVVEKKQAARKALPVTDYMLFAQNRGRGLIRTGRGIISTNTKVSS